MKKLQGSVGRGGRNFRSDVTAVQRLLRLKGFDPEIIDGICGSQTIIAIEKFQATFMHRPNGLIEQNGMSWNHLVSAKGAQRLINFVKWEGDPFQWSQEKKLESMHPKFRSKVKLLMGLLRGRGFQPTINNAWRSRVKQAQLFAEGKSKARFSFHNAQHPDGTPNAHAADIVDQRYEWDENNPQTFIFFNALGEEAKKVGLYWGGAWEDWAHVQLLPNSEKDRIEMESRQIIEGRP